MKIRQQSADYAKAKSGIDEDAGLAASCSNLTRTMLSGMFQGANYSCPDSDHATAFRQNAIEFVSCRRGDLVALNVQRVGFNLLVAQWLERTETDMQSDFDDLNAARANFIENLRSEM